MIDRTRKRSDNYQNLFVESLCSSDMLADFANSESIYSKLNPFGYNEEFFELKEKLRLAFWRIVETQLTKRQKEVLKLTAEGLTQTEIAKELGVNQSSVTKSRHGNCDYRGNQRRVYGGSEKKIKKLAEQDPEIQAILKRLAEIQDEEF